MFIRYYLWNGTLETPVSHHPPSVDPVNHSIWMLLKRNQAVASRLSHAYMWFSPVESMICSRREICGRSVGKFLMCFRNSRIDESYLIFIGRQQILREGSMSRTNWKTDAPHVTPNIYVCWCINAYMYNKCVICLYMCIFVYKDIYLYVYIYVGYPRESKKRCCSLFFWSISTLHLLTVHL